MRLFFHRRELQRERFENAYRELRGEAQPTQFGLTDRSPELDWLPDRYHSAAIAGHFFSPLSVLTVEVLNCQQFKYEAPEWASQGKFHSFICEQLNNAHSCRYTELSVKKKAAAIGQQTYREDRVSVTGYFTPAVRLQLKQIGIETGDRNIQDMLTEALNDFFAKYGKKPIA